MLDQLVESKSNSRENTRRSGFLLTTLVILTGILLSGWVYSLFALDYGLGAGDLELSTLVAPVQIAEEAPPPPEPEKPQEKQQVEKPQENVAMRTENVMRLDESPTEPPKVSTVQSTVPPRPKGAFVLGDRNVDVSAPSSGPVRDTGGSSGSTLAKAAPEPVEREAAPPPPPPPPPKPTPKPAPKTISGGVVNGKARNLVTPPYPASAKAVRAGGEVKVQVTIDEDGNVISASAVSGHPLLRSAAVNAARASKFTPTQLSGQPVKVTGVIIYNFTQ
jgi:protein TonB